MDFIRLGSLAGAFAITIVLMLCHYFSRYIFTTKWINAKKFTSFAGGVAVTYVFLHMLPELVEGNETIGELLKHYITLTPIFDLTIFIVALIGFNIYFGLEVLAQKFKASTQKKDVFRLHLFMSGLHNFIITYTMALRVQTGVGYSIIFTIAVGLHFVINDKHMNAHFPEQFNHTGRLILVAALFLGWIITVLTDPINVVFVSLLIAFLAGSILYKVFHEEIPSGEGQRYLSFTLGSIITAVLLILLAIYSE